MAVAAVDMVSERTMSPPCRVPVTGGNTVRTAEGGYGVYGGGEASDIAVPFCKSAML